LTAKREGREIWHVYSGKGKYTIGKGEEQFFLFNENEGIEAARRTDKKGGGEFIHPGEGGRRERSVFLPMVGVVKNVSTREVNTPSFNESKEMTWLKGWEEEGIPSYSLNALGRGRGSRRDYSFPSGRNFRRLDKKESGT